MWLMHPSEESQSLGLTCRDSHLPLQQVPGSETFPHIIVDTCTHAHVYV